MKFFGQPKNRWGWLRAVGFAALGGVLAWTALAAGLRSMGEVGWMAWSGYQSFPPGRGLELAVVALSAALVAAWMEEHERRHELAVFAHLESQQNLAAQREEAVGHFRNALQAALAEAGPKTPGTSVQTRDRLARLIRENLRDMDGRGKGGILLALYEQNLLDGEFPCTEMISEDFSGIILANADLSGVCLEGIDLSRARLNAARLVRSRLSASLLKKAILRQADLREAELSGCNLRGANLDGANLEGADLRGAYLDGAFLRNANLRNCVMTGFPAGETHPASAGKTVSLERLPACLNCAILIDTIIPDGRKVTNENGKKYLRDQEYALLVDKL